MEFGSAAEEAKALAITCLSFKAASARLTAVGRLKKKHKTKHHHKEPKMQNFNLNSAP